MKPLLRTIAGHAKSHRDRMESSWQSTPYSQAQASQIIARIDTMLSQVPTVIKQAHERTIGGRNVSSREKVLSVYEPDVNVLVRGKAGKENVPRNEVTTCEPKAKPFGNTLMIAESMQGLILDWPVYREAAPAEWRHLQESVQRKNEFDVVLASIFFDNALGFGVSALAGQPTW